MTYLTIASTFTGNKGAASMLEATIQSLSKLDRDAKFIVFTIYPEEDEAFNNYNNVTILSAKPIYLALVINPLTLVYKILPPVRSILLKNQHIKAFVDADVVLDQGGITFVDGRTKFLIYNIATILPGIFTNTKTIKCSQAMGPFTGVNRIMAKLILPKMHTIYARGDVTLDYLLSLGLSNVEKASDLAFLLKIEKNEAIKAKRILKENHIYKIKGDLVGLLPSEVVRKKAEANGQDYVGYNVDFINKLIDDGKSIVLMAYSARGGNNSRHNNDLLVCRDIANRVKNNNLTFIDKEISAQQLRYIVGKLDVVVTSRFHAMIAALSMKVPTVVVGWSHKYQEIMDMFGLSEMALSSDRLDARELLAVTRKAIEEKPKIVEAIEKNLPKAKVSSLVQINGITTTKN